MVLPEVVQVAGDGIVLLACTGHSVHSPMGEHPEGSVDPVVRAEVDMDAAQACVVVTPKGLISQFS